jgi:hypothetical protein
VLKGLVRDYVTLTVVGRSCKSSAKAVVDRAIREMSQLNSEAEEREPGDSVWALIDLEDEGQRARRALAEQERAKRGHVKVALSKPCFEVWTLLHFEDTGESFLNCAQVIDRVKQRWKERFDESFDRKARADYSKIIDLRHEAARRARAHCEQCDRSYTEAYKIIDEIDSLAELAGQGDAPPEP